MNDDLGTGVLLAAFVFSHLCKEAMLHVVLDCHRHRHCHALACWSGLFGVAGA